MHVLNKQCHRSGNFHVRKLSYDKLSYRKIFVGMAPYHVNVNSVRASFVRLIFVAAINYENVFTTKISRFTVLKVNSLRVSRHVYRS